MKGIGRLFYEISLLEISILTACYSIVPQPKS